MPDFEYKALDPQGVLASGTLSAASRAAALNEISHRGLSPVRIAVHTLDGSGKTGFILGGERVPQTVVEAFHRELANLLAAGVAMIRALDILCREATNPTAKRQWRAIYDDVAGGLSLAEAMGKWPQSFPAVFVAMVKAGETGGFLDVVLAQIAEFQARRRNLKSKIRSALVYPAVLAVLAVGVLIFLLTYFIPRFSAIFTDFGAALPSLTRVIVSISSSIVEYGLVALFVLLVLIALFRRLLSSPTGRRVFEQSVLRTPGLGTAVARFALVRFSQMLGTLLSAGVPLIRALRVARDAIGNETLADAVGDAINEVQQGRSLSRSLIGKPKLFPAAVIEMIAVAEETSRLDVELQRLAVVYEEELDRRLRLLVSLAEPALLFVMAALVGIIVVSMLLPVFTLQELIR